MDRIVAIVLASLATSFCRRGRPFGCDVVLAAMGIQVDVETSFQKVRQRWAQLRSGDEMTFKVFPAGRVIDLKGRVP